MQKRHTYQVGASTLSLEFGDITTSKAHVLVSSDDSYLTMGGGVSAAIRRAAGQVILLEVAKNIPAKLGDVVVTGAGSLPAKHVFHAITIGDGDASAADIVASATRRSLALLKTLNLSSIAFPAIGAGAAGFGYDDVAVHMAEAIVEELRDAPGCVDVTIYLFDRFGHMQPIDYIKFFEEFAARTRGLTAAAPKRVPKPRPPKPSQTTKRKMAASSARTEGWPRSLTSIASQAVSVFVSYSHADETWRKELGKHLSVLERQGLTATWHGSFRCRSSTRTTPEA